MADTNNPAAPRFVDVPAVTRTHEVLLELGHRVTRQVLKDGSLSVYTIIANPERADKWGCVPEADWALCDAAEAAPTYGPRKPRAVYVRGAWDPNYIDPTDPSSFDAPRGTYKQVFSHYE